MSADRMEPRDRDPEEIRREIRRTRGEMDDTVDQLVDRLSVGNVVDEVWQRLRSGGSGGGMGTVLRDHPIPLALMGLGLGWMAVEQATGHSVSPSHERSARYPRGRTLVAEGPRRSRTGDGDGMGFTLEDGEEDDGQGLKERVSHAGGKVKDKAAETGERVKHAAAEAGEQVKHAATEAGDRVKHAASEAGDRVKHAASALEDRASDARAGLEDAGRKARRGMQHMLDENPLALGSILFGLGLASGLSLPSTRFENKRMGETSEHLKEEAKAMAKKGAQKVKEAGKDVAHTAKEAGAQAAGTVLKESREKLEETREAVRDRKDGPGEKDTREKGSQRTEGVEETTAPTHVSGEERTTGMPGTKGRKGSHGTTDSGGFGGTSGGSRSGGL